MNDAGINVNKSGNVSARCTRGAQGGFLVTPPGCPTTTCRPDDLVLVGIARRAPRAREPSQRVALPPRHLRDAAGGRGGRAHPFAVRHHPRLPGPRHSRPSTTGGRSPAATTSAARPTRPSARRNCRTRALAALADRTRLPAGAPWSRSPAADARPGACAGDRSRAPGAHLPGRLHARRTATAGRGRDGTRATAVRKLRTRCCAPAWVANPVGLLRRLLSAAAGFRPIPAAGRPSQLRYTSRIDGILPQ